MKSFGLGDVVMWWIEAYLSGRVSRVQVSGEHSGAIPMRSGVLQGSLIGPLLFLIFVNDLPDALEALALLFADDDKMVTLQKQNMNLHSALIATWDWSKKRDLPINPTKCIYLTIGRAAPLMGLAPPTVYPN